MKFTILNSCRRFERWSAYESDDIYYMEVLDEHGRKHNFKEFYVLTSKEIEEKISEKYEFEARQARKNQLIQAKKDGTINIYEALELLDMLC